MATADCRTSIPVVSFDSSARLRSLRLTNPGYFPLSPTRLTTLNARMNNYRQKICPTSALSPERQWRAPAGRPINPIRSQKHHSEMPMTSHALIVLGLGPDRRQIDAYGNGNDPRPEYLAVMHALQADIVSVRHLLSYKHDSLARKLRRASKLISAVVAFISAHKYRTIYCTGEDTAFVLAPLLRLRGWRGSLITLVHAYGPGRSKTLLKRSGLAQFGELVVVSANQAQLLRDSGDIAELKVHQVFNWVDTEFFTSDPDCKQSGSYIYACGQENRDYATLGEAARLTRLPFRVTASGWLSAGSSDQAQKGLGQGNIIVDAKIPYSTLRSRYQDARLVVLPLHPVSYAAGVTGLVEAMAMAKPVVVTASPGIEEYLADAAPGMIVKSGDPGEMANAIRSLWDDPDKCRAIGERNRQWAVRNCDLERYGRLIASVAQRG